MREIVTAFGAVLAFLVPLGIYCLILASINRRSKPLLVSGAWDSFGLLFAGSGFFLVTLPMLFSEFYLRAVGAPVAEQFFNIWLRFWILWLVYFLLLISGGVLMLLWRAHTTMIYNVDAELFPKILERTLPAVGLGMTARQRRLFLMPAPRVESADSTAIMAAVAPPDDRRYAELSIESFPTLCHVTLHWDNYTPDVRRDIEKELGKNLVSAAPLENPAAGWFLSASGLFCGVIVMIAALLVYLLVITRRWD